MSDRGQADIETSGEAGRPNQLTFDVPSDATDEDVLRLIRIGSTLGFNYNGQSLFEHEPEPDPKVEMAMHIDRTYPPHTIDSYLVKEHFGIAAVELDFAHKDGSKLFTDLVFPSVGLRPTVRAFRAKTQDARALTYKEAGLDIIRRDLAGIEPPPVPILASGRFPSLRESFYKENFPDALDLDEAAISVASLIKLGNDKSAVNSICTARSRLVIRPLVKRLEELTG